MVCRDDTAGCQKVFQAFWQKCPQGNCRPDIGREEFPFDAPCMVDVNEIIRIGNGIREEHSCEIFFFRDGVFT